VTIGKGRFLGIAGGDVLSCDTSNLPPVATFIATPPTGNAPLSVFFDATGSTDADGTILTYAWDFGDGTTGMGDTISHVFTMAGTYSVRLIVTDDSAATDSFLVEVVVNPAGSNLAPEATFIATPTTGTAPLSVFFDATGSTDSDGQIVSYAWDFGDGTTGMGDTVSHIFTMAGTYTVRLLVTDDSAATDSFLVSITVNPGVGNQAPEAIFTATPPTGNAPLNVFFDATGSTDSDGQIVSYDWDFGDGTTGMGDTTSHIFTEAGTYRVRLLITDDSAAVDSFIVEIIVNPAEGNQAPEAIFTATPPTGNAPLNVFFDATGSTDSDGQIVSYDWDFGDNSTSTGDTTSHVFTTAGNYDVRLIVTDDSAATDTFTLTLVVNDGGNLQPTASFIANPTTGEAPLLVNVDASASVDLDGNILAYNWDFGDGTTGQGITTSHTYQFAGIYIVRLIVTDNGGLRDTAEATITVSPPVGTDLIADLRMIDTLDCENNVFTATLQIRSANTQVFNLGTSSILVNYNDSALQFVDYESYTFDGSDNCIANVAPAWAEQAFDGASVPGIFNLTMILQSDEQSCPEVNGTDWISIGKITFSILDNTLDPEMVYDSSNTNFNVNVPNDGSVTVAKGALLGLGGNVLSCDTANIPPVALFMADPMVGAPPLVVTFDANASSDIDGTIVSYEWLFGDGGEGTGLVITHTYNEEGSYEARLIVTDDQGAKDTATVGILVSNGNLAPVAVIVADTLSGNAPFDVAFDGSNSVDVDGTIESYQWDFGDGIFGEGPTPSHIYLNEGTYTVRLIVTDDMGAKDTASIEITVLPPVENLDPIASFIADPVSGNAPLLVSFDATLSSDPDGQIVSYDWFFGDGILGTGDTTSYQYTEPGEYTVMLVVTDDNGAKDTAETVITVIDVSSGPVADLRFVTVQDCESDSLTATIQIKARTGENFNLGTSSVLVTYDPEVLNYADYSSLRFNGSDQCIEGIASAWEEHAADGISVPGLFNLTLVLSSEGFGCPEVDSVDWVDIGTIRFGITNPALNPQLSFDRDNTNFNVHDPNDGTIVVGKGEFNPADITPCDSNQGPEAIIVATPDSGLVPLEVSFIGSNSQDVDGEIVSYFWDFGDGATDSSANVVHTFTQVGEYTVVLIVTDNSGASDTAGVLIKVVNPFIDPVANLRMQGEVDCETNTLNVSLQIKAETETSFNIGDSRVSLEFNTVAMDLIGYTSENFNENTICGEDARNPWSAHVSDASEILGQVGIILTLNDPGASCPIIGSSEWITIGTLEFQIQDTSMLGEIQFDSLVTRFNVSSPNDGSMQVGLGTLTGLSEIDLNCLDDLFPPIAVITTDTTIGFAPLTISFSGSESTDPDSNIVSYFWDFGVGDSVLVDAMDTSFTFTTPGNYTVTLIVEDADGLRDTAQVLIQVGDGDNFPPVILCNVSPDSGITPINVLFDATQSFDPDGDELTFTWEFGDGLTGEGALVNHVYTIHGEIVVTLTVEDGRGGVSVQEKTLTLFPPSFENPGDTLDVEGFSLQWDVFPNPLEDFAIVRLRDIGEVDQLDIEMYDHAGRLVFLESVIKLDEILDYRIDLGSMSSGVYVIAIRTENSLSSRHVIIK
ncbi:MAG: PKD domain-containing protein, partial [Bacteroidota bacterium]